ncbi:MAG TPA: hypothetical protein VGX25_21410 [Actinophytocola sp.]|uniref:hypothetical protein n=1 Tax=Actinophytocola sp. TaxID=1872138 RepID=UPI002DDCD0D4|nr:hypothetical protein [Actinophytocola sp.]HEV2781955.1 hypothetical protein [Actinophytocola sp.]
MGVPPEGPGAPEPFEEEAGSDDEPTHQAQVTIEKSDMRVRVTAAPRQLFSLLQVVACLFVVIGATTGPALTFIVVPANYPVWAMASTSIGQLAVLALVAITISR